VVNGLHLYSAMATKVLLVQYCPAFTHSYTDGDVSHARRHPACREQLGLDVLLM